MKKLKSKLTMELSDTEDVNKKIKVCVDSSVEHVFIGAGKNADYPRLQIHRDDVEGLIGLLTEAIVHKLPISM